ncbi:hypothetical protein FRB94_010211 [Tulasnella sp. JGI-2019a]|nr:hypothetical protein FRB93_009185 [Tulasnella sp. JGI-2019a]KAG8993993.1 hypothetical protein FRB94_010211 [Tulasnella sp. JGI-2019a]KAG9025462.1 hypothetical protein FRB95_010120 [Tulasnella sp. JGI-2019a]
MKKHLKVEFIDEDGLIEGPYLSYSDLCRVGHELGSLPMPGRGRELSSVDTNLKLHGYEGIYICDLSVFPMSPEANPALTLAALSLRLSRYLVPRSRTRALADNQILVVNHSGEPIKVWVTNLGQAVRQYMEPQEVKPGADLVFDRKSGVQESVMVYRLNKADHATFSTEPELFVGHPGGGHKGVVTIN